MGTREALLISTAAVITRPSQPADIRHECIRHLNQEQLARRWQISPRTLERHRWLGTGVQYLKLNGRVVYRLEDVLAFEAENIKGVR